MTVPGLMAVTLDDLDLVQVTQPNTDTRVRVNFPFSPAFPATTGHELEGGHNVVYFEIAPGDELGTHRDSPEELVVCLDGDGVEARAGDATGELTVGDVAVIPPLEPHGFRNVGDETARLLGLFSDSTVVGEFEEPLEPLGERVVRA